MNKRELKSIEEKKEEVMNKMITSSTISERLKLKGYLDALEWISDIANIRNDNGGK